MSIAAVTVAATLATVPMPVDGRFRTGSVTRPFLAAVVMQPARILVVDN